jgi:hypothetical protein
MPNAIQLAERFLECMVWTPIRLKPLIVFCLAQAPTSTAPRSGWIKLEIENEQSSLVDDLKLYASVAAGPLASEIILAAANGTLRIEPRFVVWKTFSQSRIVLLIDNRIVGQIFASSDGKFLRLAIAELFNARDRGDGIIAVEEQDFEIHAETPVHAAFKASGSSDTVH